MTYMTTTNGQLGRRSRGQRGAILIVSLLLLLVMTIIGVFAMRGTTLEERMAGNLRDRDLAFQAAEAALREAESNFNRSDSLGTVGTDSWRDRLNNNALEFEFDSSGGSQLASPVEYVIEERPQPPPLEADQAEAEHRIYRVTARSTGGSGNATVILQSEFRR